MGQLEKYGLYVLCLVIFLILGVTIWGGGDVPPGRAPSASIRAPGGAPGPSPVAKPATGGESRSLAETLLMPVGGDTPRNGGKAAEGTGSKQDGGPQNATADKPVPPPANDPGKPDTKPVLYKVQEGDTFETLARTKLGKASLWPEIQRLNPDVKPEKLRPGQEIRLPVASAIAAADAARGNAGAKKTDVAIAPAPDAGRRYTVKKGDNYERIAQMELGSRKRTNELMELNSGIPAEKLRPGMSLVLPKK